jgi:RND family efflux transporter MFP subunit
MHPNFRSGAPGDCGICGMKLVPDEETAFDAPPADPGGETPAELPMGSIRVSPEKQQLIGVRYGTVELTTDSHDFRAVGKVAVDETRVARVQAKIDGWIGQVLVNFIGRLVQEGQPLLTLYSPEMLASQQEYLLALRARTVLRDSPIQTTAGLNQSLIAASRRRLELWDLSDAEIHQLETTGEPVKNITVFSPIAGYVMTRNAFPSQRITPETELYTLADLSRVWIMADVFESEAPMIREGMAARIKPSYGGSRWTAARVDYIQPQVDGMTRTLKIRLEAANPSLRLKPEMFVDVEFHVPLPPRLTVLAEAVLDSGLRQTVFVDRGNGYLEPRQVQTGDRIGDRIQILGGLAAGERVATSANFLIDSESQLKAAAAGMAGHQHGSSPSGASPPAAESTPEPPVEEHKHD